MSEKYYTCVVKVSEDSLKETLENWYSEEEINDMSESQLQSMATETIDGIMSDHFSDYWVIDKNTIVLGNCND